MQSRHPTIFSGLAEAEKLEIGPLLPRCRGLRRGRRVQSIAWHVPASGQERDQSSSMGVGFFLSFEACIQRKVWMTGAFPEAAARHPRSPGPMLERFRCLVRYGSLPLAYSTVIWYDTYNIWHAGRAEERPLCPSLASYAPKYGFGLPHIIWV